MSLVILVVEDEWLVRDVIADALRALDGIFLKPAMRLMRDGYRIDLIFTDIQLAGLQCGWDVAEQCRAIQPRLSIIYTSGNSADRSRRVAGSLFFDKPYRVREVVEACRRLMKCAVSDRISGCLAPAVAPSVKKTGGFLRE
jgi:CheY-like chemotaxis protein